MFRIPVRHIAIALLVAVGVSVYGQSPPSAPAVPTGAPATAAAPAKAAGIEAILGSHKKGGDDEFLAPDEAFRFAALAEGTDRVRLNWEIAEGYYLYRARIKVSTSSASVQLGSVQFPPGQVKNDEYFGRQEVYHHELVASVPVARASGDALDLPLEVTYQGCADAGLCYPPQTKTVSIHLSGSTGAGGGGGAGAATGAGGGSGATAGPAATSAGHAAFLSQEWFSNALRGNLLVALACFYLGGLVLSCTPCVLPMVPILSGIIIGSGAQVRAGKSFALSASYVLGMALTYAVAGVASAAAGKQVQAMFQQWWVIALFAAVFVVLALSMFGVFTLQMPVAVQSRLAALSNRQSASTFGGVAFMGALSALIVTTCVAPVLVGALLVISQTGAIARGGAALFAAGIGMGTPLLVVGASAGKLLPRPGPWMELIKKVFGVLMLAVAAWMLARIVPERVALVLWAVPALILAWLLWSEIRERSALVWGLRTVGVAAGLYGVALAAGAALGGTDPLAPIPALAGQTRTLEFRPIKSLADLQREVTQASAQGRGVLVDFSADWCTSCKEMERYTFTDPQVQAALSHTVLLRADVTRNDADDQALLKHFGIFGPPTIAFYGADGRERAAYRVVGYMKAAAFAARSRAALHAAS
ncbi:MAG TPA: protein-disulfide reductase DsbD [Steroidobacteraceae bacterium]|nr:protein-disulfide reductase DsbD [Steroidobacteraceae bacterium]